MGIKALTPATTQNLISLAQVKLYLSETTTTYDTLFSSLIAAASSSMIRFIGVSPARQRYEERGYGTSLLYRYLSRLPVEPGTLSIELDGVALTEDTTFPVDDTEDFCLVCPAMGEIYRPAAWVTSSYREPLVKYTYHAGFLMPDQVSAWALSTAKTAGSWVRPSTSSLYRFECTTLGTTGLTEPVWPTVIGETVTDGTAVWTTRAAQELPEFVSMGCFSEFLRLRGGLDWTPGVASRAIEGVEESRFATQTVGELAPNVAAMLLSWRTELGLVGVA